MMKLLSPLMGLALSFTLPAADLPTSLTDRGALIFSDDLASLDASEWKTLRGKWEIRDGALKGTEIAADNHAGVVRHYGDLKDAVVQFDFRFTGAKMASLSFNGTGHICRVQIDPQGYVVKKDDGDHGGPDKMVPFGRRPMPMGDGWHTVLAEIVGDTMAGSVDGTEPVCGSHPAIAQTKANFGFLVGGESAEFRNVRVWEAVPKKEMEAIKKKLIEGSKAKPKEGEGTAAKQDAE